MAFNENAERDRERRSAEEVKRSPFTVYDAAFFINLSKELTRGAADLSFILVVEITRFPVLIRRKRIPRRWGGVPAPSLLRTLARVATMAKPTLHERRRARRFVLFPPCLSVSNTTRVIQRLLYRRACTTFRRTYLVG